MIIFPAIDLVGGKAVRLLKGNYDNMTVYSNNPLEIAQDFVKCGATHLHLVDLEGAKDGGTPNIQTVENIVKNTDLFTEIGGGIRDIETIKKYNEIGVDRFVLGTAAVTDEYFLQQAVNEYGDKIAVGVDIKDEFVAIKGWTEKSSYSCFEFCEKMDKLGVKTLICTDISKDGAMQGTNHELYKRLSEEFTVKITASGGVSSMEDIIKLKRLNLYGAIIGKAYYTKAVSLKQAIEVAK